MNGPVAHVVIAFNTFLGLGGEEYTRPGSKLDYDMTLEGFRTDITEQQLREAPIFYRDRDYACSDREREQELHNYWRARFYWGSEHHFSPPYGHACHRKGTPVSGLTFKDDFI